MFFIFIFKDVFTVILLNTITMILIVKKKKDRKITKKFHIFCRYRYLLK